MDEKKVCKYCGKDSDGFPVCDKCFEAAGERNRQYDFDDLEGEFE